MVDIKDGFVDIFAEYLEGYVRAREAEKQGTYPYFKPLVNIEGTTATTKDGKKLIMLGSNNYLGLTNNPEVREAAKKAIDKYGTSCTGSRFLNGTLDIHNELEEELADFVGKPAALVFSTGMFANLGTISSLVGRHQYAVTDTQDHASIVDGSKLSLGKMKRFSHNDLQNLEHVLDKLSNDKGKLVVTEGVFSMGGDIAPLPKIVTLCQKYGARLMVDDAHSIGVLGNGHGTAAHFGVTDEVDIIMGTFSKSLASIGGFVAGDKNIMHYVQHTADSMIFTASLTPPSIAAALASLRILRKHPELFDQVNDNANYLRGGLQDLGYNTGYSETPIIPIVLGDEERTLQIHQKLVDGGVYTNPVLSPGVPENQCMLRVSVMATQEKQQLDKALDVFEKVREYM